MAKLCKDQREGLVAKLTAFFKGLTVEEIDDVVTEARQQATVETVQERKNGFAKLFDSQMEALKSRGCPQAIMEAFSNQRDAVLSKAAEMEIPEEHIPFVPVIPRTCMGIYGLMPMVRNGDKVGYTYLDPNEIIDQVETPKNPYFIYDVEDGKDMVGKSPEKAEKLITEQKRSCLTVDEGIAVCIHTNVLSEHYVDCTGSRYPHADLVPDVYLDDDKPLLDWSYFGSSNDKWGSASCRSRV
ncbi:hypothetical protein KKB69_01090 [Patescibacteria group bacterium]|nr:hypothetical protein [Patescibacteria group bacterium]